MATKTALYTAKVGTLVPVDPTTVIEVVDWDTPKAIIIEPSNKHDRYLVVREGIDGNFDQPVTDEDGEIILHSDNREAVLTTPDKYSLRGVASTTLNVYQLEV